MVQYTGMMKGFWTKGIAAATHILNCAPCKNLAWRTPYEVLFGHVPDITYLCIFGCHAWVFNNQGKKWDLKSKTMTLVGFETGSKAYCLWDLTTSSIVVSTNGCFDKNMFPHKPKPSAPEVHAQPIILSSKSPPPVTPTTSQSHGSVRMNQKAHHLCILLHPLTLPLHSIMSPKLTKCHHLHHLRWMLQCLPLLSHQYPFGNSCLGPHHPIH